MEFESLYAEHYQQVYRFALSLCLDAALAEEITQETFVKALTGLKHFRGESSIKTWLCHIAKNLYYSHKRGRKTVSLPEMPDAAQEDFAEALADRDLALSIHRRLHGMEEPYREVFTLRVFGELDHAQIGSIFGKSEAWSRITFYRAKVRLQERIRETE